MIRRFGFLALMLVASTARAQDELPEGHAPVSEEALRRALGEGPQVAESAPSADVPAHTVAVTVLGDGGEPLAGVDVRLGSLANGQSGAARNGRTGADGRVLFAGLGGTGAYRVTVEHEGARYLSAPFQLDATRGQAVTIRRFSTTRDARVLLQRVGRTILEWKPERVHVTQLVELMNLGSRTFVFARPGLFVPLPEGATAFEAERSMNDQRLDSSEGGFRISGSIPPGRVQLRWQFDLPLEGDTLRIRQNVPFAQTAAYQVVADSSEGMDLVVFGFPDAQQIDYEGRKLLVTEIERGPQDPPIRELRITVTGIPSPGPLRYLAIGCAILLVAWGVTRFVRHDDLVANRAAERARAREALFGEVDELARQRAEGSIGDAFLSRERDRLVEELALLAKADAEAEKA